MKIEFKWYDLWVGMDKKSSMIILSNNMVDVTPVRVCSVCNKEILSLDGYSLKHDSNDEICYEVVCIDCLATYESEQETV